MQRFIKLTIGIIFIFQACNSPKPTPAPCNTCQPLPPSKYNFPTYKPPTKAELENYRLLKIKRGDSLKHLDFRGQKYTNLLNYPLDYVQWMGRRGPGYVDPPIPKTVVDTVMRIETHDSFMGQAMTSQNVLDISQMANFRNVDFNCYVNFSDITFKQGSMFSGVNFNGPTRFYNFKSLKFTTFNNIHSRKTLLLEKPQFDRVSFTNIQLDSAVLQLFGAQFNQMTAQNIQRGHFRLNVDTAGELMINKSHFERLTVEGDISTIRFDSVYADHDIDLTKVYDKSFVATPSSTEYPKHKLFLHSVDLAKVNLDYSHFRLVLKNPDSTLLPANEIRLLYEGLLKNFKDRGRTDSYQLLDAEYQIYRDESRFKWRSTLNSWWWNFGYDPIKIFEHILQFLLIFVVITFFTLELLQKNVYSLEAFEPESENDRRSPHGNIYEWRSPKRFLKRLWYSTAYASVVFLLLSIKIERLKLKSNWRYVLGTIYVIIMHITGLICLGYVANFILQRSM